MVPEALLGSLCEVSVVNVRSLAWGDSRRGFVEPPCGQLKVEQGGCVSEDWREDLQQNRLCYQSECYHATDACHTIS